MGVAGQDHVPAALPPGKTRYPLYRRLGGSQGRSGRLRKISPPTGIRSPGRPARSESPYRLSYPGPPKVYLLEEIYEQINEWELTDCFHSIQHNRPIEWYNFGLCLKVEQNNILYKCDLKFCTSTAKTRFCRLLHCDQFQHGCAATSEYLITGRHSCR